MTLINLAHFAFVVVFLMRFANEASEQAREQHQDWGMGAMTMMMTPRLLRSIHAGFVTVAAHDPEPEPALARLHRSAHAVHVHPRLPLSPSLPVSLLICVSRFCILIALSYSHQHQPPSPPLDGATCATWPPACNSSDNFSLANPLCCTCLRLSCRVCVSLCLTLIRTGSSTIQKSFG